ncbi:MAG TPA: PQQ-binding-like beta-propeller repeat protein [Gaiellaceae bacterium]|nr:PQQ-binding-like beta-propeller repeat protein [Gaiellaceae bacterium]
MRRRILLIALLVAVLVVGAGAAYFLKSRERPGGKLDTELKGVSASVATTVAVPTRPKKKKGQYHVVDDKRCWNTFGGDPARTLSRPGIDIGLPLRHFWVVGLRTYIEYPPSYCDGILYVNSFGGRTVALDSHSGKKIWERRGGKKPSTPAIAGPRLIVTSHDGNVTAYNRYNGQLLWRLHVDAKIESSPVAIGRVAYFGATDGRLFAVYVRTGRVKWAYNTGGRINSSPSVSGNRLFVSTYAGSIFCLRLADGHKIWNTYLRRNVLQYESFYASASTDGRRVFTIARSGKIYALSASSGRVIWTAHVGGLGYSTPAIAHGRVFIGGFDGYLRAFRAATGRLLWRRHLGGRILGGSFVAGNLVFTSTLAARTFALRVSDGKVLWRLRIGKYSPGIVTERHYFFTLNGIVMAWHARRSPQILAKQRAAKRLRAKKQSAKGRVTTAPQGRTP